MCHGRPNGLYCKDVVVTIATRRTTAIVPANLSILSLSNSGFTERRGHRLQVGPGVILSDIAISCSHDR